MMYNVLQSCVTSLKLYLINVNDNKLTLRIVITPLINKVLTNMNVIIRTRKL